MKKIILLNKKEGETPLEALDNFRKENKEYKDSNKIRMTYAGRLDPMASGLLLILAGDKTKEKEKYLALDKEYEFEILFGFATDTYDILGKVVRSCLTTLENTEVEPLYFKKKITENLKFFTGKLIQKYPVYSSRTVGGRPLFEYARSGELVEIPDREVIVKSLKFLKLRKISAPKLLANIKKRIKRVKGDFRQEEIIKVWRQNLQNYQGGSLVIAKFKIKCSSGTYVRSIANGLGEKMSMGALAFSIKRTKIGNYKT